jgi:DNA processing protein
MYRGWTMKGYEGKGNRSIEVELAIARAPGLKTAERLVLAEAVSGSEDFAGMSRWDLEWTIGRKLRSPTWDPRGLLDLASADSAACRRLGIRVVSYWDGDFPPLLREIAQEPYLLFYRGELPDPERPALAIVGTRAPTPEGRARAYFDGRISALAGVSVVSGLARGIDAAAHRGCLEAGWGTVAVLGCGIDLIYPSQNRTLARRILGSGGCILSEYPPGTPPARYRFPERNRIISGLARAVLVVEAPERSGALITAAYALEQGRDLFVSAATLEGAAGGGLRSLRDDGAPTVSSSAAILEGWGVPLVEAPRDRIMVGKVASVVDGTAGPVMGTGSFLAGRLELELEGKINPYSGEAL